MSGWAVTGIVVYGLLALFSFVYRIGHVRSVVGPLPWHAMAIPALVGLACALAWPLTEFGYGFLKAAWLLGAAADKDMPPARSRRGRP